ncbi:MAG: HAD-IA family hydrolase [Chloroflexi bacterium]|nr:HAD-IA family hydrolase [Chloroflexota bacterium]MDE2863423.1 HAD-IA family hydrolase [Chloroflexota bacterium]MXW27465.1 HAD-IA family hydrolase [Chloroflexota bacterium]MXX66059.1 HAD-IA family hydrolase [Chloroflexota bacterium]MXY01045.1 HAD-IA family hydrolase [Chloroflexota bacterium]
MTQPAGTARPTAVCFDGFGTLFRLGDGDPARAVCDRLRGLGYRGGVAAVAAGLRAEFSYYRSHHKYVGDAGQLADLQRRCGQIVLDALGDEAAGMSPLEVGRAIAASFPPRLYPETRGALERARRAGLVTGVLSNYSFLLEATLRELEVDELFDFKVVSGLEGVAKPDPQIFALARRRAGVGDGPIAHIGDSHPEDYLGAERAGFRAVLLDRSGSEPPAATATATDLNGALDLFL